MELLADFLSLGRGSVSAGNLLLSCDAVWAQECRSYLSEDGEPDVPKADRHNYGGVHR